jgi:hypothetical protein
MERNYDFYCVRLNILDVDLESWSSEQLYKVVYQRKVKKY